MPFIWLGDGTKISVHDYGRLGIVLHVSIDDPALTCSPYREAVRRDLPATPESVAMAGLSIEAARALVRSHGGVAKPRLWDAIRLLQTMPSRGGAEPIIPHRSAAMEEDFPLALTGPSTPSPTTTSPATTREWVLPGLPPPPPRDNPAPG